ncbi:MAG TPA: amidohydrolase family protein [Phycisphaerales bacterium]|nr:amidohydrolase family protein [Phycisphaerales bacterium]
MNTPPPNVLISRGASLPPLRESHAHLHMLGRSLGMLSLADCTSIDACLDRVRSEAARLNTSDPSGTQWLMACAMRIEGWTDPRWPTRAELDESCGRRPAVLLSFDHHSAAANTTAFTAAGMHDASPNPEGGVIARDAAGAPTGVLLEAAAKKVWNAAPEPGPAERAPMVKAALAHLHALGFREVHDLLSPPWLGPLLADLSDRGELLMPVGLYPLLPDLAAQVEAARAYARRDVTLMGGKVFADGTLNARTAWMLSPYADAPGDHPTGMALMREESLRSAVAQTRALGVGLAVHAIGDAAVRATLNAWEHSGASPSRGEVQRTRNGAPCLRIEHCEIIDERDVPRFASLGVVCSVQPCHLLADIDVLERALPHRLHRVLPLRDLIRAGSRPGDGLVFGSDVPIVRADPADSIQAATQRRRADMPTSPAIAPEQSITLDDAVRAFHT